MSPYCRFQIRPAEAASKGSEGQGSEGGEGQSLQEVHSCYWSGSSLGFCPCSTLLPTPIHTPIYAPTLLTPPTHPPRS
jgi:hypothetical protein